jgi:hypothetical protein
MGWRIAARARRAAFVSLVLTAIVAASCGGDDSDAAPATSSASGNTAAAGTQQTTTRAATGTQPTTTGAAVTGKLPDVCAFLDDATAATAMGVTAVASKGAPQPATDVASRCDWTGGIYSISLTVRKGTNAKSSFDNVVSSGFTPTTLTGSDARVNLGARETSRNYRLVTYAAYNGTYFVYILLQGRDRPDTEATEAAATLVRTTLSKLGA